MKRRQFGSVRKLPSGRWQASYWHLGRRHIAEVTLLTKADANAYLARDGDPDPAGQLDRPLGRPDRLRRLGRGVESDHRRPATIDEGPGPRVPPALRPAPLRVARAGRDRPHDGAVLGGRTQCVRARPVDDDQGGASCLSKIMRARPYRPATCRSRRATVCGSPGSSELRCASSIRGRSWRWPKQWTRATERPSCSPPTAGCAQANSLGCGPNEWILCGERWPSPRRSSTSVAIRTTDLPRPGPAEETSRSPAWWPIRWPSICGPLGDSPTTSSSLPRRWPRPTQCVAPALLGASRA